MKYMLLIATILVLVIALGWIIYSTQKEKEDNDRLRVLELWIRIIEVQRRFADNATADVKRLFPNLRFLSPSELRETQQWKLYYESEAVYFNMALKEVHEFKNMKMFIDALQTGTVDIKDLKINKEEI